MYKIFVCLLFVNLNIAFAQLQNPSFERTDSLGNFQNWQLKSGQSTQLTGAQFGVIPFTPYDGNYFLLLESDTQMATTQKGIIEQTFAYADTPGSITFPYFYIPESTDQHAQVSLLFTKWNGNMRDTVLIWKDTIAAVADSNQIRIQWNTYAATLTGKYAQSILPDTATVTFLNDDGTPPGKKIRLYLDLLTFGKWGVGLTEPNRYSFEVFPNPANQFVSILTGEKLLTFELIGIDGKQYFPQATQTPEGFQMELGALPSGMYFLHGIGSQQYFTKRLFIIHEN
jgi:hypothetical protein